MQKRKMSWDELIAKGDHRIDKIQRELRVKYQGIPNRLVFPHFGRGTGTDIIVAQDNKILELHEVTNYQRFAKNGQREYLDPKKVGQYVKSLTRRVHKVYFGKGQRRLYSTPQTKKFFHISYEDNLSSGQRQQFENNGIEIVVHEKTDFPMGYTVEDHKGKKKSYLEDGTEI